MKKKPKAKQNKAKNVERINLNAMSITQLKAAGYDVFAEMQEYEKRIQQRQRVLKQINDLIVEKTNGLGKTTVGQGERKPEIETENKNSGKKE